MPASLRHPRRSLLRGAMLGILWTPLRAAGASLPPIDALMQALAGVPARRADFIEIKTIAALSEPITATGALIYRRPDYLAKITAAPHAEQLVVDGDQLTLTEGTEAPHVIALDSHPRLRALVDAVRGTLSGNLASLRRQYTVTMTGSLTAWRLDLTPIEAGVASLIRLIAIEGTGTTLRTVRTVQANGDESRMTINPEP
ncbi:MAG TPA: LolA-related protein [Acetobacteraceae bacterium]|nr:LolA-related protein [Acetobacteraceae bacterium]